MSAIRPEYKTISNLFGGGPFGIDEYQREYKWEKRNIDELLTDLLSKFQNFYRNGDPLEAVRSYGEYFLGSIIISERDGKRYLIDGQQRVTSLTLLLIHIYHLAKKDHEHLADQVKPLIYKYDHGHFKYRLEIPERLPLIEALFKNGSFNPDGKDESTQTMFNRFLDIEQFGLMDELGDSFPNFADWLITKVGLIEITAQSDAYAYTIFETMNDRGKPLSPVDMLKAYLLAQVRQSDLTTANQAWKKQISELASFDDKDKVVSDGLCIKAWLRAQYAETIRERKENSLDKDWELIGTVFHRWVRDKAQLLGLDKAGGSFRLMTIEFPFFCSAYQLILEASETYKAGLESVFYNAHNEFTWQPTVLLAPLCLQDSGIIVKKKLAVTATFLDIWIMRRVVNYIRVSYSSSSYAMWSLCRDIRRKTLPELVEVLTQRLANDDVRFSGSKAKDRDGIEDFRLNQFTRRYLFHLLARVTAATEKGAGRGDPFDKLVARKVPNPFDIEHILPNKFSAYSDEYETEQDFINHRNHAASLLLLPGDVNRSLQDRAFSEKLSSYSKQNFYAATLGEVAYQNQPQFQKYLKDNNLPFKWFTTFGKEQVVERTRLLRKLVELIWSPERLKEVAQ